MLNFTTICHIVDKSSYHAARINVSRNALLNSRSEDKKHFLWRSYRVKTNQKVIYRGLLLFSQTVLFYCFGMLSEFGKVFERKIWRVQVADLHNVGVGVFNCQQILKKISFVIFNVVVKNKSNVL